MPTIPSFLSPADSTGLSGLPDTFQEFSLDQDLFSCLESQIPMYVSGMLGLTAACRPTPLLDCPGKNEVTNSAHQPERMLPVLFHNCLDKR